MVEPARAACVYESARSGRPVKIEQGEPTVMAMPGGGKDGTEGPPGVFIMDCETFEILGR